METVNTHLEVGSLGYSVRWCVSNTAVCKMVRHPLNTWFSLLLFAMNYKGKECFPGGSEVKASACNAGDLGLIPGLGRSPGEGNGNPLQYSCLENPWTEESGGLRSTGSQRVGHDWATSLSQRKIENWMPLFEISTLKTFQMCEDKSSLANLLT